MSTTKFSGAIDTAIERRLPISRLAHVVERVGLAMSGATCGTFVAAQLAKADDAFGSVAFIASMILFGIAGFYLGIDIPPNPFASRGARVDPVELLSAVGTFLAAIAALTSVYAMVFDVLPPWLWEFVAGAWLPGVLMQIVAGWIGRLRLENGAIG
jgi:hypothetical protein